MLCLGLEIIPQVSACCYKLDFDLSFIFIFCIICFDSLEKCQNCNFMSQLYLNTIVYWLRIPSFKPQTRLAHGVHCVINALFNIDVLTLQLILLHGAVALFPRTVCD